MTAVRGLAKHSFLVAGLGNLDIPCTRHSIGIATVNYLADVLNLRWTRDKSLHGFTCSKNITDDINLVLVKSKLPMNINGKTVAKAAALNSISSENIFLLHDELDKPLGKVSLKEAGSARGHKGVKSVVDMLKTDAVPRLRIGIDRPTSQSDVPNYVLERFPTSDQPLVKEVKLQTLQLLLKTIQIRTKCEQDLKKAILGSRTAG